MSDFNRISLVDLAQGALQMVPDAPNLANGALHMLRAKPERAFSIGLLLEQQTRRHPNRPALRFGDRQWTYREFNGWVNRVAALFERQGIRSGDVVGILMENRPEMLVCVAAAIKLGAVAGMLNFNQRDAVLTHSIGLIKPKLMVTSAESVEALETTPFSPLNNSEIWHYWLPANDLPRPAGYLDLETEVRAMPSHNPAQTRKVLMKQPCFYIFTSGTTGMPKASVMTHYRWLAGMAGMGLLSMRLHHDDVLYCALPLYHNNALTVSWGAALGAGACLAISRKFSASRFWDEVRQARATAFCYIGELCRYLLNQPPSPKDRQHLIRVVVGNGLRPEIWQEFKQRFGIERIAEFYGASECNLGFVNSFNLDGTAGFCPLPFSIVAYDPETELPLRGSDGFMKKVHTGEVGLLITQITERTPFDGYTDPAATEKKLFRDVFEKGDCYFNSGDLVRDQGFRHIQFVDRLGDTFRWKGENVATTEVEAALNADEQIEQAVVYGVQVPNNDGRAGMAALTLNVPVAQFDGKACADILSKRLPAYAIPVFIRLRTEHEITGTFKNRKVELKNEGFDLAKVSDPIFYFADKVQGYLPLTPQILQGIGSGQVRV